MFCEFVYSENLSQLNRFLLAVFESCPMYKSLQDQCFYFQPQTRVIATPIDFIMLYLVSMYRSWFPLFISTKINTKNYHVTSLIRHIRQNGKKKEKNAKFVSDHQNPTVTKLTPLN